MDFIPDTFSTFRFVSTSYDHIKRSVELRYALDDKFYFTERYVFPKPFQENWEVNQKALEKIINLLHLAVGVSYFKTAVPPKIEIKNQTLSKDTAEFFNTLYLNGLGEFAFRNKISLKGKINFPYSENVKDESITCTLPRLTAVPLGGGKDSIVTLEALLKAKEPIIPIALGNYKVINEVAECRKLPLPIIERHLDPQLMELNKAGAYNGHVPISAIIVFTLATAAILCGFDTIAISQERSANEANVEMDGLKINHQYSKSFEVEKKIQDLLQNQIPNLRYFSLLRPLSELAICKLFAKKCESYHHSFSSCNRSFSMSNPLPRGTHWCGNCPKCRFIFLALAPFMEKENLISIFQKNLLNNEAQKQGYLELLGLTGHKPFECVGEINESRLAFALVAEKSEWQNDLLITEIKNLVKGELKDWLNSQNEILQPSNIDAMPSTYREILNAF